MLTLALRSGRAWRRIAAVLLRTVTAALLVCSVVVAPLVVEGQARVPRVGVIGERSDSDPHLAAFRKGLLELGYTEGKTIVLEYRYARGDQDRVPKLAADLVRTGVDVLLVGGTVSAQRAKGVALTVPIVFALAGDPVASGLVSSLARPGGNLTGLSNFLRHRLPAMYSRREFADLGGFLTYGPSFSGESVVQRADEVIR